MPMRALITRRWNKEELPEQGSPWLITFTDLMALMLTFFVLMFSMSDPRQKDWDQFTGNVAARNGSAEGAPLNRGPEDAINIARINYNRALDLSYLESLIRTLVAENKGLDFITVTTRSDSLVLSLPGSLLFETGQADMAEKGQKALYLMAETLGRLKNRIEIVGNTDPGPIISPSFSSQWELSLARAAVVSGVLQTAGYGRPLTVRGASSGVYDSLDAEMPDAERRQKANTIDIVIMEDDGNRVTVFDIGAP